MNDALQQLKTWRDSLTVLNVSLSSGGKTENFRGRIDVIGESSVLVSRIGEANPVMVRRLDDAYVEVINHPSVVIELLWPDGSRCSFAEY